MHEIGNKIESLEIIDDLLNMTLEVRRFEKNYFLYGKEEDYQDNKVFLDKLGKHILHNSKLLTPLVGQEAQNDLWHSVLAYRESFQKLHGLNTGEIESANQAKDRHDIENNIRIIGKKFTDLAEQTSSRHLPWRLSSWA